MVPGHWEPSRWMSRETVWERKQVSSFAHCRSCWAGLGVDSRLLQGQGPLWALGTERAGVAWAPVRNEK